MARKRLLIILPFIALLIFAYLYTTLISPSVTVAELVVDAGTVQVMHAGGEWADASNGMLLKEGDSVRTLADSEAAVIFFESSIMRLGPETEIGIQTLDPTPDNTFIIIRQESGRTWNKILKLSGIDGYDVETPTTVASVRGTCFSINVSPDGGTEVQLVEGELNASTYTLEEGRKKVLKQVLLKKSERVQVLKDMLDAPLQKLALVRDRFIESNLERDTTFLRIVKERLLERFSGVLPTIKQNYNLTDEQMSDGLDRYLSGEDRDFGPRIVTRFLERRATATEVFSELASGELEDKQVFQTIRQLRDASQESVLSDEESGQAAPNLTVIDDSGDKNLSNLTVFSETGDKNLSNLTVLTGSGENDTLSNLSVLNDSGSVSGQDSPSDPEVSGGSDHDDGSASGGDLAG